MVMVELSIEWIQKQKTFSNSNILVDNILTESMGESSTTLHTKFYLCYIWVLNAFLCIFLDLFSFETVKTISTKHFKQWCDRLMTAYNFTHSVLFHQISLQILQTICDNPVDLSGYILPMFKGAMNFLLRLKLRTSKHCFSEFDI